MLSEEDKANFNRKSPLSEKLTIGGEIYWKSPSSKSNIFLFVQLVRDQI
jgi:hypothetical protein